MSCEHAKNHLAVQLLIYLLRSKNDEVSSSKSPFLLRSTKKKKKKSRKTNQINFVRTLKKQPKVYSNQINSESRKSNFKMEGKLCDFQLP